MPDSTSRFEDPFADLFGKLPDPRMRGGEAPGPRRTPAPPVDDDALPIEIPRPAAPTWTPFTESPAPQQAAEPGASAAPTPQTPVGGTMATTGPNGVATGALPLSRRAAREALRAQTGDIETRPAGTSSPAGLPGADPTEAPVPVLPPAPDAAPASERREPLEATAILPVTHVPEAAPRAVTSALAFDDLFIDAGAQHEAAATSLLTATRPDSGPIPQPGSTASGANLEDLFMGKASPDELGYVPPRTPKRRRRVGGWIALGIVLVVLGGLAAGAAWVWNTYEPQIRSVMGWEEPKDYEEGLANGEALVTIASGDTGSAISQSLFDAGVTKTSSAFYDMLVDTAQNPTFYPGVYKLQKQMTSAAALTALQNPANKVDNTVVLPEGIGYKDALQRVADATGIPADQLLAEAANFTQFGVPAEAPSIEGFLFPATYTFDPGVTAHDAIARMVNETFSRLDALGVAPADRLHVLTLASIIQKESGPEVADMAKISRVFLNRIDTGMPLQSDATVAYGANIKGTVWTTDAERADASNPYNTYVHEGLTPGPISMPGEDAMKAAMSPADGPWIYFVAVDLRTGETVFSETLAQHEAAVKQLQSWCAAADNASYCK